MKDIISFMKEELKEYREHDQRLFEMLLNQQNQAQQSRAAIPDVSHWQYGFSNQLPTLPNRIDRKFNEAATSINILAPKSSAETFELETKSYHSF